MIERCKTGSHFHFLNQENRLLHQDQHALCLYQLVCGVPCLGGGRRKAFRLPFARGSSYFASKRLARRYDGFTQGHYSRCTQECVLASVFIETKRQRRCEDKGTWIQKVKRPKDCDRRLQNKASPKDGTQGNKGLRGNKADTDFMADVAAPILLADKLSRASGSDPSRRLQTAECFVLSDASVACVIDGFPGNGFYTVFVDCPAESPTMFACLGCAILGSVNGERDPENDPPCLECSLCFESVAYDCSNLAEGNCVEQTCSGACIASGGSEPVPSPTPMPVSQPSPTPMPVSQPSPTPGRRGWRIVPRRREW